MCPYPSRHKLGRRSRHPPFWRALTAFAAKPRGLPAMRRATQALHRPATALPWSGPTDAFLAAGPRAGRPARIALPHVGPNGTQVSSQRVTWLRRSMLHPAARHDSLGMLRHSPRSMSIAISARLTALAGPLTPRSDPVRNLPGRLRTHGPAISLIAARAARRGDSPFARGTVSCTP